MKSTTLLLTLLLASVPQCVSAVVIESWQFNETVGTQISGLTNDIGSASFSGDKPQVTTDGAGALAFSQGADGSDNVFRIATLTTPNQTSGIFELEFSILSADLSGGDGAGANVGFGFRESDTNTDLFVLRLHEQSDTLRIQTRIGGTNSNLYNFGANVLAGADTPLVLRAVADLDHDLLDVYYTLGTGTEQSSLGIAIPDLQFDEIRMIANTNSTDWGAADLVTVDYLTLSQVETATGDVVLEVNTTTGETVIKNETGASLSLDFYEITSASSLNPSGWNSLNDQDLPGFPAGDGTGNGWEKLGLDEPPADFDLDGVVDALDLAKWEEDYGLSGSSDADGDADSDGADFLSWQRSLNDTAVASSSLLSEGFLTGNSLLADTETFSLGSAFQVGGAEDLAFLVRLADGTVLTGEVQYVSGAALVAVPEPSGLLLAMVGLLCAYRPNTRRIVMPRMGTYLNKTLNCALLALLFALTCQGKVSAEPDRTRPNIVVVYADDMGIGDSSAYQDTGVNPDDYQIDTPNMERLAAMGTRFTDVHTAAAVCSPSRVSLLTGRYSFRTDLKRNVIFTGQDIDGSLFTQGGKQTKTVGNLLQDVGYRTYGFGKWHLGLKTDSDSINTSRTLLEGPTHLGFDRYIGTSGNPGGKGEMIEDDLFVKFTSTQPGVLTTAPLSGSDTPSTNWVVNDDDGALQQGKLTQRHLNAAKTLMNDHQTGGTYETQPFFIYYASHANHAPYYVSDAIDTDANGTPASVPITGNTVAGGPIRVLTGPDNDADGLPDPIDPQYPSNAFDNAEEGWLKYYEEDEFGNQIDNPASQRADMVHENDIVLGELLDYLEATDDPRNPGGKLIENTLVIFTSDNGANLSGPGVGGVVQVSDGQPTHLRGKKGTAWEGGTRVPFIASWAGQIQEGLTSDALFGQQDLYATFAEITEQTLEDVYADAEGADSESILDALQGMATGVVRDTDMIYKRKAELVIRRGDFKLIATESDYDDNGERIDPGGATTNADWQDLQVANFFDLSNDVDEANDLKNDPSFAAVRNDMLATLRALVGPNAEAGFSRGIMADINHDLALDATDWQIFKGGFGDDVSGLSGLAAYKRGDLDGDMDIDVDDFSLFKGAYDLANGVGAFAAMVQAVPEPSTLMTALTGTLLMASTRRRKRCA